MGRILRFTLIGCGGLVGLIVFFGVIGAVVGGGGSPPEQGAQGEKPVGEQADNAAPEEPQGQPEKQPEEQPQERPEEEAAPQDEGGGVVFRVTGDPGVRFQGSLSTMDISKSVQGATPQDFPLKGVDTGMFSSDIVSCNAQKMAGGSEKLIVQIVVDGEVVKQANTTAQYGLAQVTWSPTE